MTASSIPPADIAALVEAGQQDHPGVVLPNAELESLLLGRNLGTVLFPGDLYLACACEAAVPAALEAFEALHLGPLPSALARESAGMPAEELRQRVRDLLLVREAGARPRLASYTGRGPLGAFVRVCALRALAHQRREAQTRARYEAQAAELPLPQLDPELRALRDQFRNEFEQAFRAGFAALSAPERNLFRFHYLDGVGLDGLGRLQGCSRATAHRRLVEARQRLAEATLAQLSQSLRLAPEELESLIRTVRSRLEVSLAALMREVG